MNESSPFVLLSGLASRARQAAIDLPPEADAQAHWTGLGFNLLGQRFVAPMDEVSELMRVPVTTRIPGVKNFVLGIGNVRGRLMAVLDLAPELPESPGLMRLDYKHVPMLDLAPPSRAQLNTAIAFIEAQPPESKLFIHCALGYSRSVAVLAAYLIKRGHDLDAALAQINARRPGIVVPNSTLRVLRQFEHQHRRNLNCPN